MNKLYTLAALAAFGFVSGCYSSEIAVAKERDVQLTLFSNPCTIHPKGQHAEFTRERTKIKGCWIEENGVVWVLYEDGDREQIPRNVFTWAK